MNVPRSSRPTLLRAALPNHQLPTANQNRRQAAALLLMTIWAGIVLVVQASRPKPVSYAEMGAASCSPDSLSRTFHSAAESRRAHHVEQAIAAGDLTQEQGPQTP